MDALHPQSRLPFHDDPDPETRAHLRYRAEGRPLNETIWHGIGYFRKWFQKKWSAPARLIEYFDRQRALVPELRNIRPAAGKSIRVGLLGDIMWIRDGWTDFLSPDVLEFLRGCDAVFGNLETQVSPRFPVPFRWPDVLRYNSHPGIIDSFKRADGSSVFTALSLANNHVADHGGDGARDTLDFLVQRGIEVSGLRQEESEKTWCECERHGIRIGFHATCQGVNDEDGLARSGLLLNRIHGFAPEAREDFDISSVKTAVREMREAGVDFIIASVHWGYEFELYPTARIMAAGRELARCGADLILGHHPHVPQPAEVVLFNGKEKDLPGADVPEAVMQTPDGRPRKSLVLYSMGNFASTMFTPYYRSGLIHALELWRDPGTGAVDWRLGRHQWVCNLPRHPQTGRRALIAESEARALGGVPPGVLPALDLIQRHMGLSE